MGLREEDAAAWDFMQIQLQNTPQICNKSHKRPSFSNAPNPFLCTGCIAARYVIYCRPLVLHEMTVLSPLSRRWSDNDKSCPTRITWVLCPSPVQSSMSAAKGTLVISSEMWQDRKMENWEFRRYWPFGDLKELKLRSIARGFSKLIPTQDSGEKKESVFYFMWILARWWEYYNHRRSWGVRESPEINGGYGEEKW